MELTAQGPWCGDDAPYGDVVMSCRVRLARNLAGFPFVSRASAAQCSEILAICRQVLLDPEIGEGMFWVDLDQASAQDRRLLVERHLISKQLSDLEHRRAVAISNDETLSFMINEEDHLRMQVLAPGLQLKELFHVIDDVDNKLESRLDYAFSPRWGYLTACPTNVGTGIRFSVMMHLPALKITSQIERVRRAARDLHLAVRGYYGEGTESAGDFYQVSNQVTLGKGEIEILEEFQGLILPQMIEYEQEARRLLMKKDSTQLDDRIHRAIAVLRSARLLGAEEGMKLLSRVRLGIHLGRITDVDRADLNRLFLYIQPGHLRRHVGGSLSQDRLRVARATLVRQTLGGG